MELQYGQRSVKFDILALIETWKISNVESNRGSLGLIYKWMMQGTICDTPPLRDAELDASCRRCVFQVPLYLGLNALKHVLCRVLRFPT